MTPRPAVEVAEGVLVLTSRKPVAGIATHAHHDHVLWHPRLGDVPRWGSARTVALAAEHREDLVTALGPD